MLLADELQSELSSENSAPSAENIKSYELEAVDITAKAEYDEYNSGQAVNRQAIESTSSGNGDISSVLRVLPNVKIQNNSRSSNMPAELDPASISISGGTAFQNNFQIDGLEMNHDLDPTGSGSGGNFKPRMGRPQGFNIDSSLLDSVVVLDSNIPAQYGRFGGGVVQANIRKPRTDGWHGDFSFQVTNDSMTRQYLYESKFYSLDGTSESYQNNFNKFIFRASLEGSITDTLSMLAAFSTARSSFTTPIFTENKLDIFRQTQAKGFTYKWYDGTPIDIESLQGTNEQKRRSDNYFIKLFWKPSDNFNLEYNLGYMPSTNTYCSGDTLNGCYDQIQGGWQSSLKALTNTSLGLWTNQLGFTRTTNLQRGVAYGGYIDGPTGGKGNNTNGGNNYGIDGVNTGSQWIGEGSTTPDMNQIQTNYTYKSDFMFEPVQAWISTHTFRVGVDLGYQVSDFERLEAGKIYYLAIIQADNTARAGGTANSAKNITAASVGEQKCYGRDEFGAMSCGDDHYLPIVGYFRPARYKFDTFNYAVYAEDDINFDLGNGGDINTRLGVRLDGDNFLDKNKVAPRFSLQYVAPWQREWESSLSFGANRYYARNLTGYKLQVLRVDRLVHYRCGPNDSWHPTTMADNGIKCGTNRADAQKTDNATINTNSGIVNPSVDFDGLDVPYDNELMGAYSQNFGGAFNATLKYIHRDGKKQVMQKLVGSTAYWVNDGWTKSNIITLAIKNIAPIKTGSIDHFYQASLDYTNTKRNFTTYSDTANSVSLDGRAGIKLEDVHQIYKEPLTFKLNTTHIYHYGKINLLWNNLFTARGSYERIIYYNETTTNNQYKTHKFGGSFNWDTRLGLEVNGLYVNLDVLNVLDSKKLVPIGAENGASLYGLEVASAMILAYESGRQFWLQMGYKF